MARAFLGALFMAGVASAAPEEERRALTIDQRAALTVDQRVTPTAEQHRALTAEQLFEAPRASHIVISPDGRRLAMSVRTEGRDAIALYDIARRRMDIVARGDDVDLVRPMWASPTRLVYQSADHRVPFALRRAGAVHAIDVDGGRPSRLWDSMAQAQAAGRNDWRPMLPIAPGVAGSDEVLVTLADRAPPASRERFPGHDVYAVHTVSGRRRLLTADNPGEVQQFFADPSGRVRAALAMRVDKAAGKARYETWWRSDEASAWQRLAAHAMDEPGVYPVGITPDGALLVTARGAQDDTLGLYRWDFERGAPGELLLRHANADIQSEDLIWQTDGSLLGVDVPAMKHERVHFDEPAARLQAAIDRALPGRRNQVQRRGEVALVISSADTDPGSVYLYHAARGALEPVLRYLPSLEPGRLAEKRELRYRARDGLEIPAYLTLPRGARPGPLPLVVMPHGGPAERDSWGVYWDENEPYVQLLAARGIAVLQPQYRGSYGLGWRLFHSGWRQWSGGSVDDVIDGVRHLVERGIADRRRVCTMGKSSGGYTAMYALIKADAGLFRCGVSWAGTTEMALFFSQADASYAGSAWLHYMAPWTHVRADETDYMARASVVRHAARIRVPVLLAYGEADRVVPLVHGTQLRDALQRHGKAPVWLQFEGEGHGWSLRANRVAFANAVERFFAEHLLGELGNPPPHGPAPAPR